MPKRKALTPIELLRLRYQARKEGKDPEVAVVQRLQKDFPTPKRERKATVEKRVEKEKAAAAKDPEAKPEPVEVPQHLDRYSAVCFICHRIGIKAQMRMLPRNDNQIMEGEDNLYRHDECEAGSANWMASEVGQRSKYYRYFTTAAKRRAVDGGGQPEDRPDQPRVRRDKHRALPSLRPPRGVR